MTAWVEIHEIADLLRDYAFKHTYTDSEAERLGSLVDRLTGVAVVVEDEIKQAKRTAGGLSNKVQRQGATIKGLEDRLEELEAVVHKQPGAQG